MQGDALDLSRLHRLLHETLVVTDGVKKVLEKDCDEATYVLKPWPTKGLGERLESENICKCDQIAVENETEEIATGIGNAIVLAQELREKLKHNVASQRKSLKKCAVVGSRSGTFDTATVKRCNEISERGNVTKHISTVRKLADCKDSSAQKGNAVTGVATGKLSPDAESAASTSKTQSKATRIGMKSRNDRNFILENKLSVKKTSVPDKPRIGSSSSSDTSRNSEKSLTSRTTAEISNLIHKITQQPVKDPSTLPSCDNKIVCPLHGDKFAHRSVQESNARIDVVEALQRFGISNEIVKTLRSYHAFLKRESTSNRDDVKHSKRESSTNTFLEAFEGMNETDRSPRESRLCDVTASLMSLFNNTFNGARDFTRFNDIRKGLMKLEAALREYGVADIAKLPSDSLTPNTGLTTGWMSNGIWNINSVKHFEGFSRVCGMKYRDRKQLQLLHDTMQQLQRTEHLNTLIEILLRDIMPQVRSSMDPTSAEYASAYKTIIVLSQGLNPELPVLVRTTD